MYLYFISGKALKFTCIVKYNGNLFEFVTNIVLAKIEF